MQQSLSSSARRTLGAALSLALTACNAERPTAIATPPDSLARPNANTVPPASAYTLHTPIAGASVFTDVNDANLIVGNVRGSTATYAIAMKFGKNWQFLPQPTGASSAEAVSNNGEIVGQVNSMPAYWASASATPVRLKDAGKALDINDGGLVVGYVETAPNARQAFAWRPGRPSVEYLPPLRRHTQTQAVAVNDEETILGWSWAGTDTTTVLWTRDRLNQTWVSRQVFGQWYGSQYLDFRGYDIGAKQLIVGALDGYIAAWGSPDYMDYFAYDPLCYNEPARAEAVTRTGLVAGWWEHCGSEAFVSHVQGGFTRLVDPYPPSPARAYGINVCGLVVGERVTRFNGQWEAALWDPGC